MAQSLTHTRSVILVTIYYSGPPTTRRWYTDASKRHGRAGGGLSNGDFHAAFCVHGPQQVYGAETMASAVASDLAQPGDEIVLDNKGVVKAAPVACKGAVTDQDDRDPGYRSVTTKNLTV